MEILKELTALLKDGGAEAMLAISLVGNYLLHRRLLKSKDDQIALARETGVTVNTLLAVTAKLNDLADWAKDLRRRWGAGNPEEGRR